MVTKKIIFLSMKYEILDFLSIHGRFTTGESEESQRATKISPRWPTKVFAVECSRKIYAVCKSDPAHFDLALAQKRKSERGGKCTEKDRMVRGRPTAHTNDMVRIVRLIGARTLMRW